VLPDFRLEAYFSRWEFTARHHLTASDAETLSLDELLALAGDDDLRAWRTQRFGYSPTWGDPGLREAIAATYPHLDPADVLCLSGAQEGIYLAMNVLLDAGDHAVVLTPNYQSVETVPLSRCEVTGVALDPDHDWALDLAAVEAALRPNTKVVAVNFPNNPTGALLPAADFARLAALCDERGIVLFSDEVYRGLERDPASTLPQAADLSPHAISLGVMSKAYGLPGLRIGWIACRDRALLSRLERAKHYTSIASAGPSEILARIALRARDTILPRNRSLIATNTPLFQAFFDAHPDLFTWSPPQGGCVSYPRYHGPEGVEAFCQNLVRQAGVLLLPASIFTSQLTPTPANHFRLGIGRANPEPALTAFQTWLQTHPA
jgi:aspartate/methionine/tyrosine aminotransferase